MAFKPATRKGTFLLVGLTGPSGCGKTYSALRLARGMVGPTGRIAFLDTENGRGSMYAGDRPENDPERLFAYDVDELHAPFSPRRYIEKVKEAAEAKYDCLIIDSYSHAWEGTGGVLEMADASNSRGLDKWNKPKTEARKLVNEILQVRMHVIVCMRGKDKKVQAKNPETGKDEIVSAGIVPIQDERFLYELTVSLIMGEDQTPTIRKCPDELRHLFPAGRYIREEAGAALRSWADGGAPVDHEMEQHLIALREVALLGRAELEAAWKALPAAVKPRIKPFMAELGQAADEADRLAASGQRTDEPAEAGAAL